MSDEVRKQVLAHAENAADLYLQRESWAEMATVIEDRYHGVYSGGEWLAFRGPASRIMDEDGDLSAAHGNDPNCAAFFGTNGHPEVAVGATPVEALTNLLARP